MAKPEKKMEELQNVIDWSYRPAGYFWAKDRRIFLASDIRGEQRRKHYERLLQSGDQQAIDEFVLKSTLTERERRAAGSFHPAFMGGEYLPDCGPMEVEIARIAIASTTGDVTSIYARLDGDRIEYRVVDEYGGDTLNEPSHCTSSEPLTLLELVTFFLKGWDLLGVLNANFEEHGNPADMVKGFVVGASSSFYAQFGAAIDVRIDEWLEDHEVHPDPEELDDDEEG
jgi:hypothetical protein